VESTSEMKRSSFVDDGQLFRACVRLVFERVVFVFFFLFQNKGFGS
jgi:hypothetical protein